MTPRPVAAQDRATFHKLNQVRTNALEHARLARELSRERKTLISQLLDRGYSQSDVAREMGVTRQAVQKMLAAG
jgi:transposase-like protein